MISLLLIGSSCTHAPPKPNTLSRKEQKEGWTLLFNGEDLGQWKGYLMDNLTGWTVEDGTMKALGLDNPGSCQ